MSLPAWAATLLLAAGAEPGPPPPPPPPPPEATAVAAPPAAAPVKDERALALLRKLGDRLKNAKSFTVRARTAVELSVPGGPYATFFNEGRVAVQRPDKLAVSRTGDLPEFRFAYDGKTMTAFEPGRGRWATAPAPSSLDAMLVAAYEQGGLSFPSDELVVADPYAAMTRDLVSAVVVGRSTVAGRKAEHLALASPGLELQLWIDEASGLPLAAAVVYADHPHRPHFYLEYSDWRLDPKLPASTFALPKPAGATQIEFRDVEFRALEGARR